MTKALKWERKPDDRPHELMEAALRVFAERGYRAAKLEEVAEAAGVSKSTLYQYFTGKADLLLQALHHRRLADQAESDRHLQELTGPASAKLRLLVRKGFERWKRPAHLEVLRLMGEVRAEAPEVMREWYRTGVASGWQRIAALIEAGQEAGEFRRDADAEAVARVFTSGLVYQLLLLSVPDIETIAPFDTDRLVDSGLDHLLHGLRPVAAVQAPQSVA